MHPLREGISGSKFGEKTDKRHSQSSEMNEKLKGVHLCSDAVGSSRHHDVWIRLAYPLIDNSGDP